MGESTRQPSAGLLYMVGASASTLRDPAAVALLSKRLATFRDKGNTCLMLDGAELDEGAVKQAIDEVIDLLVAGNPAWKARWRMALAHCEKFAEAYGLDENDVEAVYYRAFTKLNDTHDANVLRGIPDSLATLIAWKRFGLLVGPTHNLFLSDQAFAKAEVASFALGLAFSDDKKKQGVTIDQLTFEAATQQRAQAVVIDTRRFPRARAEAYVSETHIPELRTSHARQLADLEYPLTSERVLSLIDKGEQPSLSIVELKSGDTTVIKPGVDTEPKTVAVYATSVLRIHCDCKSIAVAAGLAGHLATTAETNGVRMLSFSVTGRSCTAAFYVGSGPSTSGHDALTSDLASRGVASLEIGTDTGIWVIGSGLDRRMSEMMMSTSLALIIEDEKGLHTGYSSATHLGLDAPDHVLLLTSLEDGVKVTWDLEAEEFPNSKAAADRPRSMLPPAPADVGAKSSSEALPAVDREEGEEDGSHTSFLAAPAPAVPSVPHDDGESGGGASKEEASEGEAKAESGGGATIVEDVKALECLAGEATAPTQSAMLAVPAGEPPRKTLPPPGLN